MRFDPRYVEQVLNEHFEDAKAQFLAPLMAIHYAHLVMLAQRNIISRADAHALREALDSIVLDEVRRTAFDGTSEDLFFHVDSLIARACGEERAGRLHTARSRNDIDMTMYRMRQREFVLTVVARVLDVRECLLDLAAKHRDTLMAAHTHTQPAQPTTLAHYLLAVVEQLQRDVTRLRAAFATINQCPLGACAITGTGFPISRELTAELLGFDRPTGNTYGSIATVDYLLESVSATAVMLAGLGRFIQDLLLWCTQEFGYLRLPDGFVQTSSIMPQKRNPVALEHARALASKALSQATAVIQTVHNTPFGDIVDTEDDLQPLVAATFRDALRTLTLVDASLRGAEFDVARMEARAAMGGTTMTELADHLVRRHDVPFRSAHAIAARLNEMLRIHPGTPLGKALADASRDLPGAPLDYTDAQLAEILSARHFVAVRKTAGGPAPEETARAIAAARETLARDRDWVTRSGERLARADARRRELAAAL